MKRKGNVKGLSIHYKETALTTLPAGQVEEDSLSIDDPSSGEGAEDRISKEPRIPRNSSSSIGHPANHGAPNHGMPTTEFRCRFLTSSVDGLVKALGRTGITP